MRGLKLTIAVALVCLTSVVHAEEMRDGNWWRDLDPRFHNAYILGMMDGITAGLWHVAGSGLTQEQYQQLGSRMASSLNGIRSDAIADGLTKFYADFRNRTIRTYSALWIVSLQIRGAPAEQIERDVAMLRQQAATQ